MHSLADRRATICRKASEYSSVPPGDASHHHRADSFVVVVSHEPTNADRHVDWTRRVIRRRVFAMRCVGESGYKQQSLEVYNEALQRSAQCSCARPQRVAKAWILAGFVHDTDERCGVSSLGRSGERRGGREKETKHLVASALENDFFHHPPTRLPA